MASCRGGAYFYYVLTFIKLYLTSPLATILSIAMQSQRRGPPPQVDQCPTWVSKKLLSDSL